MIRVPKMMMMMNSERKVSRWRDCSFAAVDSSSVAVVVGRQLD